MLPFLHLLVHTVLKPCFSYLVMTFYKKMEVAVKEVLKFGNVSAC